MDALGDLTGEKYEISIELDDEEGNLPGKKSPLDYTDEDIDEFEKGYPKKAIWHGKPTIAFKEWLDKKYKNQN